MKKMSFTNSRWLLSFGRSAFLLVFALCFIGGMQANAQVKAKYDSKGKNTVVTKTLDACNGNPGSSSTQFTDDGSNDGNYGDGHARKDTVEFCPKDQWHYVKVVFTEFDLEANDSLVVFDGNRAAVRANGGANRDALRIGTGTGAGVSQAFGGWVDANCDPADNPSGCLTFVFYTDGQKTKGSGWDAWVDCADRKLKLGNVAIQSTKLTCDDPAYGIITIPSPKVTGDCSAIGDSVEVVVTNQHGVECIKTSLSNGGQGGLPTSVTDTFAIGSYSVKYTLKSDTKKTSSTSFSVQAPSLVCNDDIRVPLGSACMIVLTPDDVLEQPCDTITDTMYYNITITLGEGKNKQTLTTKNYDNGKAVEYPIITTADLKKAGMTVCEAKATVKIERIYYGRLTNMSICNNGPKSTSCETNVSFSDQSQPWISVETDVDYLVTCDTTGLDAILSAKAIDNCDDDVKVTYTVTLEENDPCFASKGSRDTTKATVVFTAVDDCGNIGTLTREYTLLRPNRFEKTKNVLVDCKADDATTGIPALQLGTIKNGVFKKTGTRALSTEEYICGYILTKKDVEIPATDCGKKTYRYWSALDWCRPENGPSVIDTTFIEYVDTIAPAFNDDKLAASDIELGHFSCTYDITKLDKPAATDNCSDPSVRMDAVFRIEDGKNWAIANKDDWAKLDCDSFAIRWVAEDDCHEQPKNDTLMQTVVIKDVTKPSAVCIDQLNVSLPNEWGARVHVKDIDAGSYDACGIESRQIRIKDSGDAWADYVDIGCHYVHGGLQIEMRVVDKKGNENICWLDVLVEDKIAPVCYDLEDKTEDCDRFHNGELGATTDADEDREFEDEEWTDLSEELLAKYEYYFGAFKCEDNLKVSECGDLQAEEQYQLIEWPCGEIEIKRRHRAQDWSGNYSNWAYQNIKITYKANWKVTLPADWSGSCGDMEPAASISIENGACDLVGYEVTEKRFDIPGDACFKIERTYHIINWCKYTAGQDAYAISRDEGEHGNAEGKMISSEDYADEGYFTYVQVLKVHDDEAPVITITDPDPCINGVEFDAEPYGEEDNTPGVAPYECDELKTWTATATDCSSTITWKAELWDTDGNLVETSNTNSISYVVTNKSEYFAVFWAFDGCGNSSEAQSEYTTKFWDCKKPTPYLLNGIAVELMQTGSIGVWATDLDQGSFDNCTDQDKLKLRIWHASLGDAPTDLAGVEDLPKVVTLGCAELGTQNVHIYAIDEEGNWDYAQTYVIVQDNMNACEGDPTPDGMVAGAITDANGETVEAAAISVNGADQKTMTTAADGKYTFMLPMGGDYTITPEKDINPLNGVSTFDLVLISKHILGISTFDTPYKYIAADVNKSGSITAFDMVQLRQLILNITSEFPNNNSWRFVEKGYEFTSSNPAAESFAEFLSINNLDHNMENMDFVAVKIGDVNGNAISNSLLGAEARTTNGSLNFNIADRFVEAGQTVDVEFTSADMEATQGYQFTLNYTGLELAEVTEGLAKASNFNTNLANRGMIATSWNGEATATDVLFTLKFTATTTGLLSELVSVSSDVTTAEAYNTAGELLDVNLNFNSAATTAGFELNQNTPNPFKAETVIGFNLPEAGTATLKVMDVQGKVLKSIKADYAKGYNQVTLKANELSATGVLYYQLESADNVATKKMIIIE